MKLNPPQKVDNNLWLIKLISNRRYSNTRLCAFLLFFLSVMLLQKQVTMTQAMQFSAFKGPFADRIDVWNGKLYMVSDGGKKRQNQKTSRKERAKSKKSGREGIYAWSTSQKQTNCTPTRTHTLVSHQSILSLLLLPAVLHADGAAIPGMPCTSCW